MGGEEEIAKVEVEVVTEGLGEEAVAELTTEKVILLTATVVGLVVGLVEEVAKVEVEMTTEGLEEVAELVTETVIILLMATLGEEAATAVVVVDTEAWTEPEVTLLTMVGVVIRTTLVLGQGRGMTMKRDYLWLTEEWKIPQLTH